MLKLGVGRKISFVPGIGINVITPQSAAAASWWLSGGIPAANCIAAYQAKGAASYAASKVNLAQPGTYNLTEGLAPSWDAATGWTSTGSAYLRTGITATVATWSYLIRFSDRTGTTEQIVMGMYNGTTRIWLAAYVSNLFQYRNGTTQTNIATGGVTGGVLGMSYNNTYLNGVDNGNVAVANVATPTEFYLLANNNNNTGAERFFVGKMQSASFYNTELSGSQMLAVSTAMAAQ